MAWSLQSDRPLYAQLVGQLQRMIVTGVYPAGSRLPSVRELAAEAAVNPNTMQRALVKLEEDGLIFTQRTKRQICDGGTGENYGNKKEMAEQLIFQFMEDMSYLGYTKEQTMTMINRTEEKSK